MNTLLPLVAFSAVSVSAGATTPAGDITEYSIEDLLNMSSSIATRTDTDAWRVPAVVTVVTAAEIQARGLRDIAGVLATVPGFYDIYDMTTHNPGVRGVSGGPRAMGSIIKVMIDGQDVSVRSSTGNLFGPELVPIQSIEQVEIIRGPASALYGADAFLAVVNIVTRSETSGGSYFVPSFGAGYVSGNIGQSSGLLAHGGTEDYSFMVSMSQERVDRSGMQISPTSPALQRVGETISSRGETENDISKPTSVLAKASVGNVETTGRFSLWSSLQSLNASGEFQDYYPLSHQTVIALDNVSHRLTWERTPAEGPSYRAWASRFWSQPNDDEVISLGAPEQLMIRNMQDDGYEVGAESQFDLADYHMLIGADFSNISYTTQTFDTLLLEDVFDSNGQKIRASGTIIPSSYAAEYMKIYELGLYGQVVTDFGDSVSVTGGVRFDSTYHHELIEHWSPRLALVVSPPESCWSAKLMYGSSFKPPSVEQVHTAPIQEFDIQGNMDLSDQLAQTYEAAMGFRINDRSSIMVNGFVTKIDGLVRYIQEGLFYTAQNATNEIVAGGELDAVIGVTDALSVRVGAGFAQTVDSRILDDVAVYSSLAGIAQPYPMFQVHLLPELRLAGGEVIITPEVSWVSQRPSSRSNAQVAGEQYMLPSYALTSLAIAAPGLRTFGDREMAVSLRVSNVFDSEISVPGFGGIDYPEMGRTIWLSIQQDFL